MQAAARHNPFAGETPFPAAGENAFLKFTTGDILHLYSVYGGDPTTPVPVNEKNEPTSTFWTNLLGRISVHDPHVLYNVLIVGLKERGKDGKLVPIERDDEWWETPPFAWSDISETLEFGLTISRWGLTPAELAASLRSEAEQAAETGQEPDPRTRMPERPTSSGSSTGPTKRASRRRKAGRSRPAK